MKIKSIILVLRSLLQSISSSVMLQFFEHHFLFPHLLRETLIRFTVKSQKMQAVAIVRRDVDSGRGLHVYVLV